MSQDNIVIFWDYTSTHDLSASTIISNYDLVANIRSACLELGAIKSFRAYGNFSGHKISTAHSELAASGVTVTDFPDNVRKEAGVKTMLVDMITHAWDYPAGHTYVIITGDRDVGYAVAMLRMRKIKVVVISSVTAHPDLTAHASVKLDWTKTALGYQNSGIHFMNPGDSKSAPSEKPPPSSFTQQSHTNGSFGSQFNKGPSSAPTRKPFETTFEAEPIELRDIPRGRRHSVFSAHDPRKFEGFGNIGDTPLTPKTQRGLFVFGDGPLFSHHGEEKPRAESVPPHVFQPSNLSKSAHPLFPQKSTSVSIGSSEKGKSREFSGFEPETPPLPPKVDAPYSGSIFEPFGDTTTSFGAMSAFPPSEHRAATISRSSSSSSSQPTNFSTMKHPDTTAPTSAKSEVVDDNNKTAIDEQGDTKASQTTLSHTDEHISSSVATTVILDESILPPVKDDVPNPVSAATSRRNSASTIGAKSQATDYEPIRTSEPVAKISTSLQTMQPIVGPSQPVVPKPVFHSPTPAPVSKSAPGSKRSPVPAPAPSGPAVHLSFLPLITVLRKERNPIPKTRLAEKLVKENSQVYALADIKVTKKFKAYITKALKAKIVSETASGNGVTLLAPYKA